MKLQEQIRIAELAIKVQSERLFKLKEKQAKELAKPKSKRILFDRSDIFCLGIEGSLISGHLYYHECINNDNAFTDKESAQLQSQRNTLVYKMRVAADDSPVDWNDNTHKYYPGWDFECECIYFSSISYIRISQLPHFVCKNKLEAFMNSLSSDEQKLLICGVE